jgi:hypothetical protein
MKANISKVSVPVISLVLTFGILYLLIIQIEQFQNGDHSTKVILLIVLEAMALFIIPFFFGRNLKRQKEFKPMKKSSQDENAEKMRYFVKNVTLENLSYTPMLVKICRYCKFENSSSTKICLNCGKRLDF